MGLLNYALKFEDLNHVGEVEGVYNSIIVGIYSIFEVGCCAPVCQENGEVGKVKLVIAVGIAFDGCAGAGLSDLEKR